MKINYEKMFIILWLTLVLLWIYKIHLDYKLKDLTIEKQLSIPLNFTGITFP